MMLAGCAGAALLSFLELRLNLLGFCLLYLAFLLDKVDGEIARYRRVESLRGMLLDRFHHRLVEPLVFLAVAYREYQMSSSTGVLVAGLLTIILANIIDEQQNISPRIFIKHLRQGGKRPNRRNRTASPGLRKTITVLEPLKGLRMFIVVLPLLALAYGAEWMTGHPVTKYYLYSSVVALFVYAVVQSSYYFAFKLEEDIALLQEYFPGSGRQAHESDQGENAQAPSTEEAGQGDPFISPAARRKKGMTGVNSWLREERTRS
jgi:phosphatidylglycerophosphate synthase